MPAKKKDTSADINAKSPVEVKKAKTVKPSPSKKLEEKNDAAEPKRKRRRASAFNTLRYRDLSGTSLQPGKKIFASFEDKLKGDAKPPEEIAAENLRASLERNVQTIFTGTVTGASHIEDPATGKRAYFVIVNSDCNVKGYAGRIVRIQLENFVAPVCTSSRVEDTFNPQTASESEIYAYINSRRDSRVEFIVTEMDLDNPTTGFIIGSRTMALARRRKKYWYGKAKVKGKPNPVFLLDEGSILDARIVSVTQKGVFVEMFGLEAFIPLRELSHIFIENARGLFEVDSNLEVVITNIKRERNGRITMDVSHRKATTDPAPSFMAQYRPNDIVHGTVTRLFWDQDKTKTVYFVNIDGKFEIRCTMKGGITHTPIKGDKVDVLIVDADIDLEANTGKIWGLVIHIRSAFAHD